MRAHASLARRVFSWALPKVALLSLILLPVTSHADILSFQDGVSGYSGTQDTELNVTSAGVVFGNDPSVRVDFDTAKQGLLRFDNIFGNGAGQIPLGSTINSATLTFQVFNTSVVGATLTAHQMLTDWNEATATWNTLVGGVVADGVEAVATADATLGDLTNAGAIALNMGPAVQAWSNGASNFGWVLFNTSSNWWQFRSAEFGTIGERPELTVDFTPPVDIDLSLTKSTSATSPVEGREFTYTLSLTNNSLGSATNVDVTDALPAGVTFVSSTASSGSYSDITGIWDVPSVAAGVTETLTIRVLANGGTAGSTIMNSASITAADQTDPVGGNNSDSVDVTPQAVAPAVIQGVQSGTATSTGNGTVVVPITAVDPSKSFLIFQTRHESDRPPGSTLRGTLTSPTTLEFTRFTDEVSTIEIQWHLVEYASGVLVQRGEVNQLTDPQDVLLPTPLSALDQAFVTWSKTANSTDVTWGSDDALVGQLTSTTNLQFRAVATPTHVISWQVIEFLDPADINVQSGSITTMGTTGTSVTATLSPAMDPAKTFVLVGYRQIGSGPDVGSRMLRAQLTNSTTITIDRSITGSDIPEIYWQAIELNDGSSVQSGSVTFPNGDAQEVVTISPVDVGRSTPFSGVQPASGQNMGRTDYALNDITGVGSVTMDLTSATQVTMDRTSTLASADVGWFVVEWGQDPNADLAVTKTVDDPTPNEGGTVTYTVVLANNGPGEATGITVTDLLPAGVTYVSDTTTQGTYVSGTGLWTVGNVANGANATLTITATVDAGTGGSTIINTASVTAVDQVDPAPGNESDSASITVQSADLAITKTVDDPTPNEGGTIIYSVVLTNNGPDAASGVQVTDLLPAGVTYVSDTVTQGSYTSGTGLWDVGAVAASASDTLAITATVDAGTGGSTIGNTASVTAADQADPDLGNNSANADITVQSADLAIAKAVDIATPNEGDTIAYTVIVSNAGPSAATGVAVTDSLPAGVTFVSSTASQGTYDDVAGLWTVGSIAAAGADTLKINVTVDAGTALSTITNTATVAAADQADPVPGNNTASVGITVIGVDIDVSKVADDNMPMEGQSVTFTIDVGNLGPDDATGVVISDVLPAGLTFVSATTSQGTYVDSTGLWTVGSIAATNFATLAITVTIDAGTAGTTIVNTAALTAVDQTDIFLGNDQEAVALNVQAVDIEIAKSVDDATPDEGQGISYTVIASNIGSDDATGVEVTDLLPAGVTFVGASATQGTYVDSTGLWTLGALAMGEADTLTIDATVDLGTAGSTIDNTATLTALNEVDVNPANDSATAQIVVNALADVAITKTVDFPTPIEGTAVTFEVVASNVGGANVTGLEVLDFLPAGLTLLSSSATNGTYVSGTGIWSLASLAPATSDTLLIVATVDSGTAGTTLTNTASIFSLDQTDSNPLNDSDDAQVSILAAITKGITSGAGTDQRPSWSPSGTEIAFDSDRVGNQDIWKIDLGTLVETQLTTIGLFDQHPDWSPTTSVIAYAAPQVAAGPLDIWTIPETGGAPTTLLADPGAFDRFPAYSRDGTQIAYSKDGDIYVAPAGGGSPVQVTTDAANDTHPTWSPDGSQIAFLSNRAGNNDIWVIPSTGGVATQLTTDSGNDGAPDWSPDGALIAFQSNRSGSNDIWVLSPLGGSPVSVIATGAQESQPDWSADGSRIAYQSDGDIHVAFFVGGDEADIRITKAVDVTEANEGQTVTYTITAENIGPSGATGVVISDMLPAGVTFSSSSATHGSYDDGTGLWSLGALGAGTTATLDIDVIVDSGTGGSTIVNTASLSALDQTDPLSNNDSGSASFDVLSADVTVTKAVDDATPGVGDTITYTITISNAGPAPATGVTVTDVLPGGLAFVSSTTTTGSYNDVTGAWTIGAMTVGQADTLTISASVLAGAVGVITNTATATLDQADPNAADNSDSADITVNTSVQVETQITSNADSEQRPTWSPGGLTIGFDSNASGNRDIYTVPRSGGAITQITTSNRFDQHPDWSPDGTQFTYISPVSGTNDIIVIPAGGGAENVIEPDPVTNDRFPNWSPDGTMIAYTKDDDIYVIPAGGGSPTQITTDPGTDAHPSWSPDGTMIVFLSNRSGNNDLWWIPSTGGVATQITTNAANDGAPDWSPDGVTIAFQSNRDAGDNDIWTIPFTGGAATQITSGTTIDVQPAWSPDGQEIAFARDGDIWVVTLGASGDADVSIAKTVDTPNPAEGATIVYEIIVANAGPDDATGLKVSDVLPAGVTFVSGVATQGVYDAGMGVWSVGVVAAADADTLFLTASVDAGTNGQTIVNLAGLLSLGQNDPVLGNNSDTASITVNTVTGIDGFGNVAFQLLPSRPNPFRTSTAVEFDLSRAELVDLSVFDVTGRLVRTLLRETRNAGNHRENWDGRDANGRTVSPGVYFVKITTPSEGASQKIVRIQ